MAITAARAREICTKSELELVLRSTTRQIGGLDVKQLRSAIRRCRTLRDKWRDLANSQARDTKAKAPQRLGDANARSGEKAQLFDEALGRFEKRLTKVDAETAKQANKAAAKPPKSRRASGHRQTRSQVRGTLNEATETINAAAAKPRRGSSAKSAGKKIAAAKPMAAKKPVKSKRSAKQAPPRRRATKAPAAQTDGELNQVEPASGGVAAAALAAGRQGSRASQPTPSEKKRNLKAKSAAKASRVRRSGAPRIQGHVSSQGRRNQAKRSAR